MIKTMTAFATEQGYEKLAVKEIASLLKLCEGKLAKMILSEIRLEL